MAPLKYSFEITFGPVLDICFDPGPQHDNENQTQSRQILSQTMILKSQIRSDAYLKDVSVSESRSWRTQVAAKSVGIESRPTDMWIITGTCMIHVQSLQYRWLGHAFQLKSFGMKNIMHDPEYEYHEVILGLYLTFVIHILDRKSFVQERCIIASNFSELSLQAKFISNG